MQRIFHENELEMRTTEKYYHDLKVTEGIIPCVLDCVISFPFRRKQLECRIYQLVIIVFSVFSPLLSE